MAGRWDDPQAGPDLRFAVEQLVLRVGELDHDRHRVVGLVGSGVFGALGEDRALREMTVAAGVIEMQVAVRDAGDFIGLHTQPLQLSVYGPGDGMVVGLSLRIRLGESRVEHEQSARVADEVRANADGLARERIAWAIRHGEVAEIQPGDVTKRNHPVMVGIQSSTEKSMNRGAQRGEAPNVGASRVAFGRAG